MIQLAKWEGMFQKIPGQTLFEFVLVVLLRPLLGFVLRHEELLQLDWPIKYRMKINNSMNTFPLKFVIQMGRLI